MVTFVCRQLPLLCCTYLPVSQCRVCGVTLPSISQRNTSLLLSVFHCALQCEPTLPCHLLFPLPLWWTHQNTHTHIHTEADRRESESENEEDGEIEKEKDQTTRRNVRQVTVKRWAVSAVLLQCNNPTSGKHVLHVTDDRQHRPIITGCLSCFLSLTFLLACQSDGDNTDKAGKRKETVCSRQCDRDSQVLAHTHTHTHIHFHSY